MSVQKDSQVHLNAHLALGTARGMPLAHCTGWRHLRSHEAISADAGLSWLQPDGRTVKACQLGT